MFFKVRVRGTDIERTVTAAAYAAKGPKVYEKIGIADESGNLLEQISPNQKTPQVSRSVSGAAPVVVKSQLVAPVVEAPKESEPATPVVEKKKPGRKKTISSDAIAEEK